MLTADLVRARLAKGRITVPALSAAKRRLAEDMARYYLGVLEEARGPSPPRRRPGAEESPRTMDLDDASQRAGDELGWTREQILARWDSYPVPARDRKIAAGLRKLAMDLCTFEQPPGLDPPALRREVFELSARVREGLGPLERFDRHEVLARVARARGMDPGAVEQALYADLKSQHRLKEVTLVSPEALVARYELANLQAVLLKAFRVTLILEEGTPDGFRAVFNRMKFLGLLYRLEPLDKGGYRVEVDGPFSLFTSVTKYGLKLAMLLPVLTACPAWRLEAEVSWGKARTRATFTLDHREYLARAGAQPSGSADRGQRPRAEVQALLDRFSGEGYRGWTALPATRLMSLPGVGLCVPDIEFTRARDGRVVHMEVLGFWSRDAVWRRVELVEEGLDEPILFAVSSRLRVSEEVLPAESTAALYVFKGVMSPSAVVAKLEDLADRAPGA